MGKGKIPVEKRSFLSNAELFLSAWEKDLNNQKGRIFPKINPAKISTLEPAPELTAFNLPKATKD